MNFAQVMLGPVAAQVPLERRQPAAVPLITASRIYFPEVGVAVVVGEVVCVRSVTEVSISDLFSNEVARTHRCTDGGGASNGAAWRCGA